MIAELDKDIYGISKIRGTLLDYAMELQQELDGILSYWMQYAPDLENGGFYGKLDDQNQACPEASKGLVLNSRILWTFSAAYRQTEKQEYLAIAARAFQYIMAHFEDRSFGGFYWSVDGKGNRLNGRKQIYGLAFCLYGLSEYYKCTRDPFVLGLCIELYSLIERKSFDSRHKGYFEAFSRDWKFPQDLRLREKDANEIKTMKTHLHLIEAYANIYPVWPDPHLRLQIENMLEVFAHHFIDDRTHHLQLFFDESWNLKSDLISYGHEIEAAWLLQEAAEVIHHPGWMLMMKSLAVKIADAASEGLDQDGGLNYESENGHCVKEKHWWTQAEAMLGFFNAFQASGDEKFLRRSLSSWHFVQKYIKDQQHGEWFWAVDADHHLISGRDKAGFWKCPYHNGRACLELIGRIAITLKATEAPYRKN